MHQCNTEQPSPGSPAVAPHLSRSDVLFLWQTTGSWVKASSQGNSHESQSPRCLWGVGHIGTSIINQPQQLKLETPAMEPVHITSLAPCAEPPWQASRAWLIAQVYTTKPPTTDPTNLPPATFPRGKSCLMVSLETCKERATRSFHHLTLSACSSAYSYRCP